MKSHPPRLKCRTLPIPLVASLALMGLAVVSQAIDYYYKGTGSVNTTTNWTTNPDGSGTSPTNFTTAGNKFFIQSGQSPTLGGAWTISGTGSSLQINTGGTFTTGAFNPTFTLNMQSGATFIMSHTTYSNVTIGTLDPTSTFQLNNQSNPRMAGISYGNLNFNGTGNVSLSANMTANGSLSLTNTGQLRLTSASNLTHVVGGDLTLAPSALLALTNGVGTMTLNLGGGLSNNGTISKSTGATMVNFSGTGSSNATWGAVTTTNFANASFNIDSTKTIVFLDSPNLGAATFSVSGVLNIGSQVLSGTSGNFSLASGATFIASNSTGLDGAITVTGTKTFSTGANYEFRGGGTGAALPATVNNLTINRSSGNITLDGTGSSQSVNGVLSILSGNLAAGATKTSVTAASLSMQNAQINNTVTTNLGGNVTFDATNNGTATIAGSVGLGASDRTFTVGNGSADIDMAVSGSISGSGGLIKAGAGKLSLSNSNTYLGSTMVNEGTLALGASDVLPTTQVILNGGTLVTGGNSNTLGSLSLTADSTIDLGGAGGLTFANSSGTWTGTTLTVWNWVSSGLKFGTDNTGLTATQIGKINVFEGGSGSTQFSSVSLSGNGTLVAVPEAGTIFAVLGLMAPLAYRERRHWMRCREARA